jgi:hypothetical protein
MIAHRIMRRLKRAAITQVRCIVVQDGVR